MTGRGHSSHSASVLSLICGPGCVELACSLFVPLCIGGCTSLFSTYLLLTTLNYPWVSVCPSACVLSLWGSHSVYIQIDSWVMALDKKSGCSKPVQRYLSSWIFNIFLDDCPPPLLLLFDIALCFVLLCLYIPVVSSVGCCYQEAVKQENSNLKQTVGQNCMSSVWTVTQRMWNLMLTF